MNISLELSIFSFSVIMKMLIISGTVLRSIQITNHAIWMNPIVFNNSLRSFLDKIPEIKMPKHKFNAQVIALVIMLNIRELSTKFAKTR
ncbi:MAG: hypothetical protein RBG13Loki_0635 [Promethearchaeota archaeon CR_4]|nr:MAG: hypothetical protein RBG13Loki_0635 [Candidatus Lokiarchaeota archaeon CR_4]